MSGEPRKVIVCGESLILECVRAGLATCPDLKVISLDPGRASLKQEITENDPVVLIFDTSAGQLDFPGFLLKQPGLMLLGIDPQTHRALVCSSRQAVEIRASGKGDAY